MLEKNNHYFQLEAGRYLYPIPFVNLNNHKVYARKKISDVNDAENFEMTAFVFFISPDNYIFNNNQIDFTGHPEILEQYDGIRISELQNYNGRQVFFSSMGNITPGNLETEFNEHSKHIKEWELQKEKTGVVIDDDDPEMQVKLPKLPEGMFWAYENGTMIAKPLKYLDGEYNKHKITLDNDFADKHRTMLIIKNDTETIRKNAVNETTAIKQETKIFRDDTESISKKIYDLYNKYHGNEGFIIAGTDGDGIEEIIHGGIA